MNLQDDALPEDLPKVFLSYSRRDREPATRISDVLRAREFGVYKDTDDILPTEEWKDRLEQLIEEADTIVFLLSPHSAKSEVCAWEVDLAASLNKRIAPIVIDDVESEDIPATLAKLNYIFCTERDPFEDAIDTLVSALNTDIDWIREHTRLNGLVRRWVLAGKPDHLLLRGQDIADSEVWRDSRPDGAPAVTKAQAELIAASRSAAARRQRLTVIGSVCGLVLAIGLAAFAFFQREVAVENATKAAQNEQRAIENAERAAENERRANETRDTAWLNQSAVLTDWANAASAAGDLTSAGLLLLAALPDEAAVGRIDAARPVLPEAVKALQLNYLYSQEIAGLSEDTDAQHPEFITQRVVFSPDGQRILTLSRFDMSSSIVRIWRALDGALLNRIEVTEGRVAEIAFLPDGEAFLSVFDNHDSIRWRTEDGVEIARHTGCALKPAETGMVHEIAFSQDGKTFATEGRTICVWNTEDGASVGKIAANGQSVTRDNLAFFNNDAFVLFTNRSQVLVWQRSKDRTLLLHDGTGTIYARMNAARDRLIVADTGSPSLPPNRPVPEGHVFPKTILIDLNSVKQIAVLSENEAMSGASFNDEGTLIVADQGTRIKTWSAETGELQSSRRNVSADDRFFAENDEFLLRARFVPGGGYVLGSDHHGNHKLWDSRGRQVDHLHQPVRSNQFYPQLAFSPEIGSLVEYVRGVPPTLWRLGGARTLMHLDPMLDQAGLGALDQRTRDAVQQYFATRAQSKLEGGDWPNGAEPETFEVKGPTGLLVATADRNGVRLTDLATGDAVAQISADRLSGLPYRHRSVRFSADGAYLLVLSEDFVDVLQVPGLVPVLSLMSEDASLNANPPPAYFDTKGHPLFEALRSGFDPRAWSPTKNDAKPRFVRLFDGMQGIIEHQKRATPRCLSLRQLKRYRLGDAPPRWCITGVGLEGEANPENWRPKPPYDVPRWRDWLVAHDADPTTPAPVR